MLNLLFMALAPIAIVLFYIYIRDKYEKEPYRLLILGVVVGFILTYPIIQIEQIVVDLMPAGSKRFEAFYVSFMVAALVEEGLKFVSILLLVWGNRSLKRNFNEKFDGIVYGVFIALGFASCENILYVTNDVLGGVETAILRGIISIPAHSFYGIFMGYYLSKSKYESKVNILFAFFVPFILHGTLDFILSINFKYNITLLAIYLLILGYVSLLIMKRYVEESPFKPKTNLKTRK